MFALTNSFSYYLYADPTDMRKSFDGLCGLITGQLSCDPGSGDVFIFVNRRRDKVKLLRWEPGGFILYYKRLETGTFSLPRLSSGSLSYRMQLSDLMLMIEGIRVEKYTQHKRYTLAENR